MGRNLATEGEGGLKASGTALGQIDQSGGGYEAVVLDMDTLRL
jgi:hypothetical protein